MRGLVHCALMLVLMFGAILVQGQVRTEHQNRTAHWIFGDGYHLHFEDDGPVLQPPLSHYVAYEGASCIADLQGNLLFYSNTQQVWNSDHDVLLNSEGINSLLSGFGSTLTQGSMFLPLPGDTADRFFVLLHMDGNEYKLYYSLIDRELDGGLGGIVPGKKRIEAFPGQVCEQLAAVKHANGRDWWIAIRPGYPISDSLAILLLTPNSLVHYATWYLGFEGRFQGEIAFSNSGNLLALAIRSWCSGISSVLALYEFDRCLGAISPLHYIDFSAIECHAELYSLAFSNNDKYLYFTTITRGAVHRIKLLDLSFEYELVYRLDNTFTHLIGQVQLGSDGQIYAVNSKLGLPYDSLDIAFSLGMVNAPEAVLEYIDYNKVGFDLERLNTFLSLPHFPNYDLGPLVGSPCDTLSPSDTTQVGLPALPSAPAWTWSVTPTVSGSSFQVSTSQPAGLTVHDLYGRERLSMDCAGQCGFDLSQHPAGWYVVSLTDRSGRRSEARKVLWQP
jgi:hypothetical protein